MKNTAKTILSLVMVIITLFSVSTIARAAEIPEEQDRNRIVFSNLNSLSSGESIEYTVVEVDGRKSTIGIKQIPTYSRTDSRDWPGYLNE